MTEKYKLTVTYKSIYREIPVSSSEDKIRIGTFGKCSLRFDGSRFFEDFYAELSCENKKWMLSCSDNAYISPDGLMKLSVKELAHGDKIILKYQSNNQEIITVGFLIDFDTEKKSYDREIDIASVSQINIGGSGDCEIRLEDELIENDTVTVYRSGEHYFIRDNGTKYGVYINGRRVKNEERLYDFDFISLTSHSLYFKYGKLYTSNKVSVSRLEYKDLPSDNMYPVFSRNTRIRSVFSEEPISVLAPPKKPTQPQNNLLTSLIPAFAMLCLTVVLRGMMSGGGSFVIFSACSMGIGILTSIFTFIQRRKNYKKEIEERKEKYSSYISRKRKEIETARKEEKEILDDVFFSVEKEEEMLREFSCDLFDRSKNDDDFLMVRLGTGITEAKQIIDYKKPEQIETEDELSELPERLSEEYRMLEKVPVVCGIKNANGVGIVGNDERLYDILKGIIIDLCVRQYQKDISLFVITDENSRDKVNWLRFIPHLSNEWLGMRNIVSDDKSRNVLFEFIYKELSERKETRSFDKQLIIIVFNNQELQRHPISRFIENAGDIGVTFIFFANEKRLIPQYCSYIIKLSEKENMGVLISSSSEERPIEFSYDVVSDKSAEYAAMRLAPIYSEEISLEGTLTKNISLFKLLKITAADDLDLAERWKGSAVYESMSAPIGVKSKDEIVYLDLHDKFHGPHGLVAGTTGSGKSEILQTYILSMATLFHPYEVSFVIIDFKGGGMVNQFRTLPHLIGAITNIDGREIERSLRSIKAELRKRQRLFAESDVNHIDKYIKKFKAGEVSQPLPHLIVIVDEFAELKAEQPEFMKELISAARIGRSLGVHLILATQKPAGQVNDQIWSNSKFKLCLKVQSQSDSNEVLKSPLAAEIKEPGRAYLQVGNNEIFELFQSAYSGAPAKVNESNIKEFVINEIDISGLRKKIYEQKKPVSDTTEETQLDAIVSYIQEFCGKKNIKKLPDICLPSLPQVIVPEESVRPEGGSLMCSIGLYDDPDEQYQGVYSMDMGNQNTMVIGSSQFGKTNLLQWIIRDLSEKYTPQELNFYIIDFGSMVLKNFDPLSHVGGVVCPSDDEKLKNLFKLLNSEIASRREKLISIGVSSFASYKEAGYDDIPQIILIVDNMTALKEMYLSDNDELLYICREGISVGISVIAANSQLSGIGYKYLSNFSGKIALYCNEASEYSSLFGSCKTRPASTPGRCIVEYDKELYECQSYLAFKGEKEIERVSEMHSFIEAVNNKYTHGRARRIPEIPKLLDSSFLSANYAMKLRPYSFVTGLDYSSVSPVIMDLTALGILSICGKSGSGKGNFVRYLLSRLENNSSTAPYEALIIDDVTRKFKDLSEQSENIRYSVDPNIITEVIDEWYERIKQRYEAVISGDHSSGSEPLLIMILQNNDVHEIISKNKETLAKFKDMFGKYKNSRICAVFSEIENAPISFSAPETMKMVKDAKNYMVFDDIGNVHVADIPMQAARLYKKPVSAGDAYCLFGSSIKKVKTVLCK